MVYMPESDRNIKEYKGIFKSTFLFGFVQVARMLVGIIKNKFVAILLGPEGLGIISIYNNIINFLKTGAGLGVSQSAVKDVSEANALKDRSRFSHIINVTNKVVIFTSLLGLVLTIVLSPLLSQWGFHDNAHIWAFVFLSVAVAFDIYTENKLAILKGMRQLKSLAKASLIGTVVALVTGVPLFYIWGTRGIIPSIIISALSAMLVALYFISKIDYEKQSVSAKVALKEGAPMVKMGISLMASNFLSFFFNIVIVSYIQKTNGLADVGYYNAGMVLVVTYFSMVTTALNTDYYPRIASKSNDNQQLEEEVFRQSGVGLLLMFPLVILFVLFSPFIIQLLYSKDFSAVSNYTDIAIIGIVVSVVSNCFGYLFIVKRESKLYLWTSVFFNTFFIPVFIVLYKFFGLTGLGVAYALDVLSQLLLYVFLAKRKYNISPRVKTVVELVFIIALILVSSSVRKIPVLWLRYSIFILLIVLSIGFSLRDMKKTMGIDAKTVVNNYINKRFKK